MAAGDIPNLKTLLGSRRGGGLRARGRGRGALGGSHHENEAVRDAAVRGTDQDAAGSRVSCVELGYLNDPYAALFATQPSTRRLPLLNRGTYIRTYAIDELVDRFVAQSPSVPKQILSLGAGTDTRFFRLRDKYPHAHLVYHELDFPTNTVSKLQSMRRHSQLQGKLGNPLSEPGPASSASAYHTELYNLHDVDLRSLATSPADGSLPVLPNVNPSIPTLILSEMCLVYLQAQTVSSILQNLLTHYLEPTTPAALVLYEPILPNDAFGRTMISNLSLRNIHLPTLTAYPELSDQRTRLKQCGFSGGQRAADTNFLWREWVSDEEKERVASLEMLDELEELQLLLKHYCVAWGWRDGEGDDVFSKAWGDVKEQG